MLLYKNRRCYFTNGKDEVIIPVPMSQEQFNRFEKHMKKLYGSNYAYANVAAELNNFKFQPLPNRNRRRKMKNDSGLMIIALIILLIICMINSCN